MLMLNIFSSFYWVGKVTGLLRKKEKAEASRRGQMQKSGAEAEAKTEEEGRR